MEKALLASPCRAGRAGGEVLRLCVRVGAFVGAALHKRMGRPAIAGDALAALLVHDEASMSGAAGIRFSAAVRKAAS